MTPAVGELLARIDLDDPFDYRLSDVRALQLEAATERLEAARETMPVVSRRAADTSTKRFERLEDIMPLFFSDATYKSYPESFVAEGRWKALGSWLDALSADSGAADVDVTDVQDIDDWLARLREAGHFVYVSSGTSGRCSLFQVNEADRDFDRRVWQLGWRWSTGALPDQSRAIFALFPTRGSHRMMDSFGRIVRDYGRPGAVYHLSEEPLLVGEVNALGRLKRDMAAGTAAPSDVRMLEERAAAREAEMGEALGRLADAVVRHRDEPALFLGTWAPQYALARAAYDRGLTTGAHPDSVIFAGGGLKGIELPDDYREYIQSTLGLSDARYFLVYGLSELTSFQPACSARRYHFLPWVIPLVLDKEGEQLVEPVEGRLTGRLGFFDISLDGRWGALISGDHGTVHLDPCPCGRPSPTVEDTIVRYADLPGGDDRVTCAGTIDSYVRGFIGGAAQ
jgi:hypothetical protein